MHVYAPGVEGYIPIEWTMKDSAVWASHPVVYPKPEILFLPAIEEKVPVYKDPDPAGLAILPSVRMTAIKPALDADGKVRGGSGTLRHQACDDRLCYIPQALAVKWGFQYEGFDRQRVPEELQRKTH